MADRTPSPTFSTTDSEITEMADERQSEMSDLIDDEAFVDDTSSDAGTEEGSDIFSDGQDPFYDRSPWFILVGRLVTSSADLTSPAHRLGRWSEMMLAWFNVERTVRKSRGGTIDKNGSLSFHVEGCLLIRNRI